MISFGCEEREGLDSLVEGAASISGAGNTNAHVHKVGRRDELPVDDGLAIFCGEDRREAYNVVESFGEK